MTIRWEPKLAGEVRDYTHDWSAFLGEDTISTSVVTVTGATKDSAEVLAGNRSIKVWLSGGTAGTPASITNTITTAGGRTETETFILPITEYDEPISLAEAKAYLRVLADDEDAKITAMIPRARLWVEDHTGLALAQRTFVERLSPRFGSIRLSKGPLVSVTSVNYLDTSNVAQAYTPTVYPPSSLLFHAGDDWPSVSAHETFAVTYVAGYSAATIDDRLLGAMFALIEGEYAEGYAYPERTTDAAGRCCAYLRAMFV